MPKRTVVAFLAALVLLPSAACDRTPPELKPDRLLQDSLGLGEQDRVYTVRISAQGNRERAEPDSILVRPGDDVQFVTADGRPHTVLFVLDSLTGPARAFLDGGNQAASPPLVERDARYVVTFKDAPPGRYPFRIEGTGAPAAGVVTVGGGKGS